jgi:hypothetical protein
MERILFGDSLMPPIQDETRMGPDQYAASLIELLDYAIDSGINTFVCPGNNQAALICNMIRANQNKYAKLKIYPCVPDVQNHQHGITEPITIATSGLRGWLHLDFFFKGSFAPLSNDYLANLKFLVNKEMGVFHGIQTPVVFLQPAITDFFMGLGMIKILRGFYDFVKTRYRAEAGFMTTNMPMLLAHLESAGIKNPVVCAAINKAGFRMAGGKALYEETLRTKKFRAVATEIFGGGTLPANEAIEYVTKLPHVESILINSGSTDSMRKKILAIKHFDTLAEPEKFFRTKIEERKNFI